MSKFDEAIDSVLDHEGAALVAEDMGRGASKYGITLKTAREIYPHCTAEDIGRIDRDTASAFYRAAFWERYKIGLIEDQALATKLLDLAVNIGPGTAIKLLQGVVDARQDGILGPRTAAVVNAVPPEQALAALRAVAERHYRKLAAARPEFAACLPGWLARLAS